MTAVGKACGNTPGESGGAGVNIAGKEGERWYRLIINNVRDFAIFSADLNGKINSWNPGAERFFGYTESEILGREMEILYVPEDRQAGVAEREKASAAKQGYSEDERWHLRKDGSRFFVLGMVNAMYDDAGQLCGFIKIARDITKRKKLEDHLKASEELHRLILENIRDFAIVTLDPDGMIQSWNPGAERTYGYEASDVVGKSIAVLYTPEDQASGEPEKDLAAATEQHTRADGRWAVRKDGRRVFTTGVVRPIWDDQNNLRGFTQVSRDVTARQELQERMMRAQKELEGMVAQRTAKLTEAVHELETFSYSLSHDMRAPLRAMGGFAEIIMERYGEALPGEGRKLMERIIRSAQRLDGLISDALTYSGLVRDPVRLAPVNLEKLVETIVAEQSVVFAGRRLQIEHPLSDVVGHEPSLMQALVNLITNAFRFGPDEKIKQPQVRLRTERADGRVRIWVEDNGIGIAPRDLDKIWRMFTRLHPEKYEGTGIGLAIVCKAVERMNGKVGAESVEGEGSRFWIELPAAAAPSPAL